MSVKLNNVRKSFGPIDVIHDVSMDIAEGEFAVFVGPSGCGKSTLLRMVAGLEESSGGSIFIAGEDVTDIEPSERGVAMVFQSYALYPHLSVYENMAFSLRLARAPKAEVEQKVSEAARILQLTDHLQKKPSNLSGGQRQRVAIGRAIVRQPNVFLFDEPLSNLDAELRVQMRLELTRLHRQLGATMIYVTHDQVEAMTLADKIFVLRDGYVQQTGAPLEIYDNPCNRFVAGFIGSPSMNFIPAQLASIDGPLVSFSLQGNAQPVFQAELAQHSMEPGTLVTLGIRPEHFCFTTKGGFEVTVEVAEELGGTSFLYTRSSDQTEIIVERRDSRESLDGKTVGLSADPKRVLVFDEQGIRVR